MREKHIVSAVFKRPLISFDLMCVCMCVCINCVYLFIVFL